MTKVPWGSQTFIDALFMWKHFDDLSHDFFLKDDNSYTLRFEELVRKPDEELKKICNFVGEKFEDKMLNTSKSCGGVNSRNVPWKKLASQPPNVSRVFAWKNDLKDSKIQLSEGILGDRMKEYGYSVQGRFSTFASVHPNLRYLALYPKECTQLTLKGIRFWKNDDNEKIAATVIIGDIMDNLLKAYAKKSKIIRILRLIAFLLKFHVKKRPIYYLNHNHSINSFVSQKSRLKNFFLRFSVIEKILISK
jgi:hypothetical protein